MGPHGTDHHELLPLNPAPQGPQDIQIGPVERMKIIDPQDGRTERAQEQDRPADGLGEAPLRARLSPEAEASIQGCVLATG